MDSFADDDKLIVMLQKGDVEAFDLIYNKYSGKLYKFGLKYLKSKSDAEELVQSVFIKIWENKKILRKELSFKSYLYTIAYNDICKLFRKRNNLQKFISDALNKNPHSSFLIDDSIDYQLLLGRVKQIIDTLPERQKSIFKKSREEGKTTKEIAAELDLSPGTIDNYISSAIKFIRSRFGNEDLPMLVFLWTFF